MAMPGWQVVNAGGRRWGESKGRGERRARKTRRPWPARTAARSSQPAPAGVAAASATPPTRTSYYASLWEVRVITLTCQSGIATTSSASVGSRAWQLVVEPIQRVLFYFAWRITSETK